MKMCLSSVVMCLLCLLCQKAETAPRIMAKDGILYQDGNPCFLVGVWSDDNYRAGLSVNSICKGNSEIVLGREGRKAIKVNFDRTDKPVSRWCGFASCPGWDEKKYKALKLWVKGDGANTTFRFVAENYDHVQWKTISSVTIGEFSLADTNWKEYVFPLDGKYELLNQANSASFGCGAHTGGISFVVGDLTGVGENGEEALYDPARGVWGNGRILGSKVKDDPVYKAIWNDPLYYKMNADSFKIIGINTFHLAGQAEDLIRDIIPYEGWRSRMLGEIFLCEELKGMPMVPGFYWDSNQTEAWAKKTGLPPSVLQRTTKGSPYGSYLGFCPENPLGQKIYKEQWQRSARHLLEHGANIYAYELVNENSGYYICGCQWNQDMFMERMKAKYGDIAALNRVWGTDYKDFDAVRARLPELGCGNVSIKGLSIEWNKFLEDRYVEVLQQGGKWIHEVEDELGKPHALMGQMGYPIWDFLGYGGADMYKMAKGLDTIETECGVSFGSGIYSGEMNPLTACMASKGAYGHQMALDLADAACPDKPIINTENYIIRYKGGREPTTKADIITSLWEEFIRGASATHTYAWQPHYASREQALAEGFRNQRLLSPYLYPRESLNGYKEVQEEIRRVADIAMKRPRLGRETEFAVLFSRPTARYLVGKPSWVKDWKKETPFYRSHETVYTYLLENHYPRRYVYEEQLPEGKAGKYRFLLVPHSDNIYPDTIKHLEKHVNNGGTLICFGDAFRYDEYGNEKEKERSYLLGLERIKTNSFTEEVEIKDFGKVKVTTERKIIPSTAQIILTFPGNKEPFITLNKTGKGSVYYVNADTFNLDGNLIDPLLDYLCREVNLNPPVMVCDPEGKKEPTIEAELIPGGRKGTVLFLVNWKPYQDRAVRISLPGLDAREKYYLADVAGDYLYIRDGKEMLTGKELQEGIYLLLPAEESVVLLLTGKKYSAINKPVELLCASTARELNEKNSARLKAELEKEAVEATRKKEIVFGIIGMGNLEEITECVKSATGDAVEEIVLKSNNSACEIKQYGLREGADSVLTYLLAFKETTKDDENDQVLTKVLNALASKYGNKLKIISGWKEADILKVRENILKAGEYKTSGACLPLDIRKQANMGFADEKADDQKGGLFDEGRSLKGLPVGSNTFARIVFDIIDPAKNNGLACIVLRGKAKPYFPEKAEGIAVGRKVKNVYLLHNASYCARDSQVVYRLKFNYTNNTDAYADIKAGDEIADWFGKPEDMLTNACPGWMGKAMESDGKEFAVILYCTRIANPHPEKEIRTLDLISANNAAVPGIFSITAEENEK